MRKQFNQFKDFVHNKTAKSDRQEVLSQNVINSEKHVENIKAALTNAEKKISGSLLSGTSDSSAATPEKKIKKLPGASLGNCFNEASELLSSSKNDSVLGKTLHLCSQLQKESTATLAAYESDIESQCIAKIQTYINEDLPSISRSRKQLNRTHSDLSALKIKYESLQKQLTNSSQLTQAQADNKLETLRTDLDDNQSKLLQCRDAYETEVLDFMSKEMSISQVFYEYVRMQASYHEKMLAQINHYIPVLEGVIANTTQKPVYGIPLKEHLRTSGRQISLVIETCISILLPAMDEEGLFRISGSVSKVKLIRNAFNAGQQLHLDSLDLTRDVHAVASALKSYLRELPEPLLTFAHYKDWTEAAAKREPNERLQAIWSICNKLPDANKNNLRYLIKFFSELTKHSAENKMSAQNLAIAIGPSLLWSNGESIEQLSTSNLSPILIESLITYSDSYFFPEDVTFDILPKQQQRMTESVSDNSDQEINISNAKQGVNFRVKKPAPKPPNISSENSNILDSISLSFDSTTSKIRSKIGSLRLKEKQSSSNEHVKNHFQEQSARVESPPATGVTATVRRNHVSSPRMDNTKSRRPISICDRPVVPPPSVPPRPSVTKFGPMETTPESSSQRHSMFDLTEIESNSVIEESESLTHSQEELADYRCQSPVGESLYPRLSPTVLENLDSAFSYPCTEFIDENQPFMFSSNDSIDQVVEYEGGKQTSNNNTTPPQKPPRSSLATHSSSHLPESEQSAFQLASRSPPPLPVRSSKSPSPILSAPIVQATHPSPTSSPTPANLISSERTYL